MSDEKLFKVIRFKEPVPSRVPNSENMDQMKRALIPGALAGVLWDETGRVYPFATIDEAFENLPRFEADPLEHGFAWEPHYSSEYEEVTDRG